MSITCELRSISAAAAQYFLQNPPALARQLAVEKEQNWLRLQANGYTADESPRHGVRYYGWSVLVAQTAGNEAAWQILVKESHEVGGLEEQYLMECEARLLLPAQVQALHTAMLNTPPLAELYPDQSASILAELQQLRDDFCSFLQETSATAQSLLLLIGP